MGNAEERYRALEHSRQSYLDRARDCSQITIPSLIPPDAHNETSDLYTPFQGIGARGVNNLASKLSLALLPPNAPFFRFMVEPYTLKQMAEEPEARTNVEKQLGEYERAVMSEIESAGDRVAVHEALKHLIVGGNVLLHVGPDKVRVFHLDSYVVNRSPSGDVLEVITVEHVSPNSLDKATAAKIQGKLEGDEKTLEVYTYVERKNQFFHVYQEVKGEVIQGSKGKYREESVPFLPLRFSRIDGEDYGRGFVEELLGDLRSLEALSQAIVEGAAAAAKVLFMVNPNGTTRMRTIAQAENTAIIEGNRQDVSVLQMDKYNDFRVAYQAMQGIEERLISAIYASVFSSTRRRTSHSRRNQIPRKRVRRHPQRYLQYLVARVSAALREPQGGRTYQSQQVTKTARRCCETYNRHRYGSSWPWPRPTQIRLIHSRYDLKP
jgi:hypothetical protein